METRHAGIQRHQVRIDVDVTTAIDHEKRSAVQWKGQINLCVSLRHSACQYVR